jgi:hypothetical protein
MKKFVLFLIGIVLLNNLHGQENNRIKIFDKGSNIIGFNIDDYNRFNPSEKEFLIADSLAKIYIVQNSSTLTHDNTSIENYDEFYKQVYGLINKNADKIIFLNCFCNVENNEFWKEHTVSVKGGGKCYFSIKVNMTDHKLFDFWINAPK